MSTYMEKLKDPRWQKKRLEVFERDGWACRECEGKEKTLHVHHTYYEIELEPWEYPLASLITLCAPCHEEERRLRKDAERLLLDILGRKGYLSKDINDISLNIYDKNSDRLCNFFKKRFDVGDKECPE